MRCLNEAFGFAARNGDAFAGVGFGFEAETFFVFTGADGIFESVLHFNRCARVLQFEGDDFKAEVVLDEGFFDDLFGFLWPLAAFVDEDVIDGIAADDFADGRDDDIAQHFFGLVRLEEVVFRVADAVLHGSADFDDVFVAGQHLPVALVAGADAAALAFEFTDFHRRDGGYVHFGDLAEGDGEVPIEAGFGGAGVAAKEGFYAVFAFAHGIDATGQPDAEEGSDDENDEFAGQMQRGAAIAAVVAAIVIAPVWSTADEPAEKFVKIRRLVVVFFVRFVVVAPGVLCHGEGAGVFFEQAADEDEHEVLFLVVCLGL